MLIIQNFKNIFLKLLIYFIILLTIILSINFFYFRKINTKHVYEISINKSFPYIAVEEELYYQVLDKIVKNYKSLYPKEFEDCKQENKSEVIGLTRKNKILNCIDKNIIFIEYASRVRYIIIHLSSTDENFEKILIKSMNEVIEDLNENIITFLNEANAVLNRAKDLGRLEIYFVWKKKIKEYKNNTDKVFEIMNNTSTEKLSYSLISTISLSIITFSFFIILVLILSIRKNV